jgi:hypothetical protein
MDSGKVYLDAEHVTKTQGGIGTYPNTFFISAPEDKVR